MIKKRQKNQHRAFTLIEVLIFITILSLFFISATTITTYVLRNLKIQEHKILATRYAQELLEWLRGEREKDWNTLISKASPTGVTYCFNGELNSFPTSGSCLPNDYGLNGYFKREGTLTLLQTTPPNTQMKINIIVKWIESGGKEYSVPINTIFSIWE